MLLPPNATFEMSVQPSVRAYPQRLEEVKKKSSIAAMNDEMRWIIDGNTISHSVKRSGRTLFIFLEIDTLTWLEVVICTASVASAAAVCKPLEFDPKGA